MAELGERSDGCEESWGLRSLRAGLDRGGAAKLPITASGEGGQR